MMASVPLRAPISPPLTGASRHNTPFSPSTSAICRAVAGLMVELSTKIKPGVRRLRGYRSRPQRHLFHVRRIGQVGEDHIHLRGHFRRRDAGLRALRHQFLHRRPAAVVHHQRESRP